MPAAHQIHPHRVPRADQVTQRLLLIAGNPDRVQLSRQQQPDEMLSVTTIGLDAIAARPGDLARRRDHTLHAPPCKLPRQPIASRAGLVSHPHRPREPRAERGHLRVLAAHRERLQLSRLSIEHRRDDLRRVHIQTDEASSLRHGWFLLCGCGPPRGVAARHRISPHGRRGGAGPFYTAGRTDGQSILSSTPASATSTRSTGAATSPPGKSPNCSRPKSAPRSDRSVRCWSA